MSTSVAIGPGLHRIGSTKVNVFLVEEAGAVTVVDAGLPGYWDDLVDGLRGIGRTIDDVRAVVLTHAHDDHIGFAERLRRERATRIGVHEADAALARGDVGATNEGGASMRPWPLITFLAFAIRKGYLRTSRVREVVTFEDGATLDVPGSPRVIHVPGHTAGSVALHFPDRDAICVGDAFVTRNVVTGSTGPQLFRNFNADNRQAIESLERLDPVRCRLVLPGHGDPWTGGLTEALRRVRSELGSAPAGGEGAATSAGGEPT